MRHKLLTYVCIICGLFTSCRKEYDHPPYTTIAEGEYITVTQLRERVPVTSSLYRFNSGDTSLNFTIIADETTGSFYSCVYARDDERTAIRLNLMESGGLYTGDRIRLNLNGLTVRHSNNVYTIDSVDIARNVVKLSSGNKVAPKTVTMHQLLQSLSAGGTDLQSDLVQLDDVEFLHDQRGVPFADVVSQNGKELTLTGCDGYTVALQTSGYANFAGHLTPKGHGQITAIVNRYSNSVRLEMRSIRDIDMEGAACTSSLSSSAGTFVLAAPVTTVEEHFDDVNDQWDVQKFGWINYSETGRARWKGNLKAGTFRSIKATAFGTGEKNVSWFITPPVKMAPGMKLSFRTGVEYFKTGHIEPLMAYVSTDFDGKNIKTANWTPLKQAAYAGSSDGNYNGPGGMKGSGEILLSELPLLKSSQQTFCVAFKYVGEPGFDTNVYLDDVVIK